MLYHSPAPNLDSNANLRVKDSDPLKTTEVGRIRQNLLALLEKFVFWVSIGSRNKTEHTHTRASFPPSKTSYCTLIWAHFPITRKVRGQQGFKSPRTAMLIQLLFLRKANSCREYVGGGSSALYPAPPASARRRDARAIIVKCTSRNQPRAGCWSDVIPDEARGPSGGSPAEGCNRRLECVPASRHMDAAIFERKSSPYH